MVRAADCRSAGPWFKSGCALFGCLPKFIIFEHVGLFQIDDGPKPTKWENNQANSQGQPAHTQKTLEGIGGQMHDSPNLHKRQNDQTMLQAGLAHINPKEVAGWAPDAGKRGLIRCFKNTMFFFMFMYYKTLL